MGSSGEKKKCSITGERYTEEDLRWWAVWWFGAPFWANALIGFAWVLGVAGVVGMVQDIRSGTDREWPFNCAIMLFVAAYFYVHTRKGFLFMTYIADEKTRNQMENKLKEGGIFLSSPKKATIVGVFLGGVIVSFSILLSLLFGHGPS